jgi:4'-phosphopantetheinyl transferase
MIVNYVNIADYTKYSTRWVELMQYLPENERSRIARLKHEVDRVRSIMGLLLLRQCSSEHEFNDLTRTEFGKPFIRSKKNFFNISHSGNFVVFIESLCQPVGIDVEEIRPIDINEFKFIMREDEWLDYQENGQFFTLWTQKEALIKALGVGFSMDIKQIKIKNNQVELNGETWHLESVKLHDAYVCWLAVQKKEPIIVSEFSIHDFLINQ